MTLRYGLAIFFAVLLANLSLAQINVTTYHYDIARDGQNTQETVLTPYNVNSTQFGKLFSVTLDGFVYAQPLYLANIAIGGGTHNVLYVATEHDSVYAIDADTGVTYWHVNLIPTGGRTVVGATDIGIGCNDIVPEVGITGTPVIDPTSGTLYVVAKSYMNGAAYQFLHALDVKTAAEKFGGPVNISGSVPGTGYDAVAGVVKFNTLYENQRPALLLENGHVVIGWASHCDYDPWHGWIMSYNASTLAREAIFNSTPSSSRGGIWMSGGGLAADTNGNIYFSTGNGSWDGTQNFGDSIVKLSPPSGGTLAVADYFTPYNQALMASGDIDVSASGLLLLPALPSGEQLLATDSKIGTVYILNQNNLGKNCATQTPACTSGDTQIPQEVVDATAGTWGSPAYWNGNLYFAGSNDSIKAFSFNKSTGALSAAPTQQTTQIFQFAAPTPTISANGASDGILWALDGAAANSTCIANANCLGLYAFDATNLQSMLYNSMQAANNRDSPGSAVKFAAPVVANGKVYVGGQYVVTAYGELGTSAPPAATPTPSVAAGTYSAAQSVGLSDSTADSTILYTTNGTAPTLNSPVYSTPLQINSTTTVEAIAVANGYSPSAALVATYTINTTTSGPTSVNFSAVATVDAISNNGTAVANGGIDYSGNAYSESLLGGSLAWSGATFTLGAPGVASGIRQQTVTLTSGKFGTLSVLATAVNGAQTNQTFKVTYTDGTTSTFTQSMSDWVAGPQNYAGESVALTMAYCLNSSGTPVAKTTYLYGYNFALNSAKTVASLTIPNNANVVVMAIDLVPAGATTPTAATPTISPATGSYAGTQTITLADTTAGAAIYYTTNGTPPTSASTLYSAPFTLSASGTVEAIAVASGYTNSAVASATYTISQSTGPTTVSLTSEANIYGIANNGTAVTNGGLDYSGNAYSETLIGTSVTWNGSTFTFGAAGKADGARVVTIPLPAGKFGTINVLGTAINGNQPGQTFVVTYTDGSSTTITQSMSDWLTPQNYAGESIVLTMPYRLTASGAEASGNTYLYGYSLPINSAKTVATLTPPDNWNTAIMAIDLVPAGAVTPTAATPTISPATGSYTGTQTITLADTTAGAAIYYTTNGTPPTSASTLYSAPFTLSASGTVEAIAVASGYTNSAVASATYTISQSTGPTTVSLTSEANIYGIANNGTAVTNGGLDYSGNAYSETLIGTSVTWNGSTFTFGAAGKADGARVVTIPLPAGKFGTINVLGTAINGNQPGQTFVVTYTDGSSTTITQSMSDWLTPQNYAGESIVLTMPYRLTASGAEASGNTYLYGYSLPINSAKTVATLTPPDNWNTAIMAIDLVPAGAVTPTAATPTISPATGSYTGTQTITLADTTAGAAIYYTTNGTPPTSASTLYSAPFTLSASGTVEAIAVASGYTNSAVASATYTISQSTGPTTVSLTSEANIYGIANNGTAVTNGGLDYSGNAYSETLIGTSVTWNGSTFTFGAAGKADGARVVTIPLPAGKFGTINVLGTAINGNQPGQTFVVTYTDGSSTTITQSMSDWLTPQNYAGESIVLTMPYRLTASGAEASGNTYLYGYSLPINSAKTVATLTPPDNWNTAIMAIDLH